MIKLIDTQNITEIMEAAMFGEGSMRNRIIRALLVAPEVNLIDCVVLKASVTDRILISKCLSHPTDTATENYREPRHPMQGLEGEE